MTDPQMIVRVALVGGPMYDPLYETIPDFEHQTGYRVEVVAQLPHPELNGFVKRALESGSPRIDLLSTHTKYAPSQAEWLAPLDGVLPADLEEDLLPRPRELSRIGGRLLQLPRNLDVRLLHYRRDLFEDPREQDAFVRIAGRPLRVPETWTELAEVASFFTRPGLYGFLFPGRDSGLFGTFYEMLVGAGGELFDDALRPAFDSSAGIWAAGLIADLHHHRRVTPRDLSGWHYDDDFRGVPLRRCRDGVRLAWELSPLSGSGHVRCCRTRRSRSSASGAGWDRSSVRGLPFLRDSTGGGNRKGATALLHWLTSFDAQLGEARRGAIPCRASALARVREEAAADPLQAHRWELLAAAEETMIIPPRFAAYPDCEDAIWRAIQEAMEGTTSPAEAVASAARTIAPIVGIRAAVRS